MTIHLQKNNLVTYRLNWAKKAQNEFLQSLEDLSLVHLFESKNIGSTNAIVYGRAQVGKTSLILKLLNIKPEKYNEVSLALRGRRELGDSSTIVPIIYSKSNNNNYEICINNETQQITTSEELGVYFEKIRLDVTSGSKIIHNSIDLKIPIQYFEQNTDQKNINIIDLPGDDSADESEWESVNALYAKYLPISNVVVIVEEVNQIIRLEKIQKIDFLNWRNIPEKYKIVLTRSLSSNKTQKMLSEFEVVDKKAYLSLFENELTESLLINDINSFKIFPVEFGNSLETLRNKNNVLYEKVNPILDQLFEDLRQEIRKSESEYNQILLNSKIHLLYKDKVEEKRKKFLMTEEALTEKKKKLVIYKAQYEKLCEERNNEISYFSEELESLRVQKLHFDFTNNLNIISFKKNYANKTTEHHQFKKMLSDFVNDIKTPWQKFLDFNLDQMICISKGLRSDFHEVSFLLDQLNSFKVCLEDRLTEYRITKKDESLLGFMFSEKKLLLSMEKRLQHQEKYLKEELNVLKRNIDTIENLVLRKIELLKADCCIKKAETERLVKCIFDIDSEIKNTKKLQQAFEKASNDEYNRAKQFFKILNNTYEIEKTNLINELSNTNEFDKRTSLLEQLYMMTQDWLILKEHIDD